MEAQRLEQIRNDPRFRQLVERRSKFAWTLAAAMLAIYYGFIMIVAFAPGVLGTRVVSGGVTTIGIPLGLAVIISAFVLTGLYVRRANSEFDALNQQIIEASK